jgi:putative ABC transport system permease protein
LSATLTPDLWMPMRVDRTGPFYNNHVFPAIARLSGDATPAKAEAELARLTPKLPEAFPQAYSQQFFDRYGFRTEVKPLKQDILGDLSRNLWVLFASVGLVLLIAAANVANLFLVRMEGRRRELGIRAALGAGRPAIARHVLAEGVALALSGGALALLVAWWAVPAITGLAPADLPRIHDARVGVATGAFILALSLAVGLALAIYPLLRHARVGAAGELSESGRTTSVGRERQRVRSALVVAQVALALTLSVGAVLLVKTLQGLRATDVGFEPRGVLAADVFLSRQRHPDDVAVWNVYRDILAGVRAIPGVVSAGMGEEIPVSGGYGCTIQGFEDDAVYARIKDAGLTTCAGQESVTSGYFQALGVPVVEGRVLTDADNDDPTRGAVVVSKAFAERFWPGEDALGQGVGPSGQGKPPFYHVVGVVGDVARSSDAGRPPLSQKAVAIYYPIRHDPETRYNSNGWPGYMTLVVKTAVDDPTSLFPAVRRAIADVDPQIALANLTDMESVVGQATAPVSFVSLLLAVAAAVALALSAVGLYGVVSYVVTRRTREIGMRMAIGARPGEVQRMVVRGSLATVGAGLVLGVGLALAATRLMRGMLVGVAPTDPEAYASAAGLLALVAILASWIPAWRASRVDPVEALRSE